MTRDVELEAVLFDLDGVLVDSEPLWNVVEEEVTGWLGGTWGPEVKAALLGKHLQAASAELLRVTGNERVSVGEVGRRSRTLRQALRAPRVPAVSSSPSRTS